MSRAIVLLFSLLLSGALHAQTIVPLEVGGAEVRIEVPADYLRLSERSPALMEQASALLPPMNRLVEALSTEEEIAARMAGEAPTRISYQVQVLRQMEQTDLSAADWQAGRPLVIRQIGALDMEEVKGTIETHANDTLKERHVPDASVGIGAMNRPVLYGDDPATVNFSMVVPFEFTVAGQTRSVRASVACVMTVVSKRLIYLYAFKLIEGDPDASIREVRAAVDAFSQRTRALNP